VITLFTQFKGNFIVRIPKELNASLNQLQGLIANECDDNLLLSYRFNLLLNDFFTISQINNAFFNDVCYYFYEDIIDPVGCPKINFKEFLKHARIMQAHLSSIVNILGHSCKNMTLEYWNYKLQLIVFTVI
jgi:hypothetical protein